MDQTVCKTRAKIDKIKGINKKLKKNKPSRKRRDTPIMPANENIQEQEDQNKTGGSLILDMSSTNNIAEKIYG